MKFKVLFFCVMSMFVTSCASQTITTPTVPIPRVRTHPDVLNHCEFNYTPSKIIEFYSSQVSVERLPAYYNIIIYNIIDVNGNNIIINSLDIVNYTCTANQVP